MWIYLLVGAAAILGGVIALAQFNMWAVRPVLYRLNSPGEIERFVRSWGEWLEERGRIIVQFADTEVEFRKKRYKSRPDLLVFRVRNAVGMRKHFDRVRDAFDASALHYELERTTKRRDPRAIAVRLAMPDMFTPVAGVRLVDAAFRAFSPEGEFSGDIWCEGRMRSGVDVPSTELIPWCQAHRLGRVVGARLGRLFS
jgi:hypothetical protein